MTHAPAPGSDTGRAAGEGRPTDPARATDEVPGALAAARALLRAVAEHEREPFARISASAALAQLDDVLPPLPPAEVDPTPLRGQALLDEASNALITLVADCNDAAGRARALLALEELHPLPLTWSSETGAGDVEPATTSPDRPPRPATGAP